MANLNSDDEDYLQPQKDSFTGVLRASGKRFRRQFNPNNWKKSILTNRHNVLCLGMSYPCVETVIANYKPPGSKKKSDIIKNKKALKIFHSAPSVERSVELVRRNLLNQIDGRDLARVVALEANNDILAYTISMEQGAYYDQRHLCANFNNRTLIQQMHRRWGKTVKFRQVILDYFWSPSGSWAQKHWQKSFFNENIPRMVTEQMLNFGDLENDSVFISSNEDTVHDEGYIASTAAVVYLPFCSHCLSQVVACHDNLSQYYTISFLRKDQLEEHTLFKATNTICAESMRGWLAKTINQEEIYCKLDTRQIKHGTGDHSVTTEDVLDVFNKIDRPDEVRMIKLTALRKFHPDYSKSDMQNARPTLGLNNGGFVGLVTKRAAGRRKSSDLNAGETKMQAVHNVAPEKQTAKRQDIIEKPKHRGRSKKRSISSQHLDKLENQQSKPRHMSRKRAISQQKLDQLSRGKKAISQQKLDQLSRGKKATTADEPDQSDDPANITANNESVVAAAASMVSLPTETVAEEPPTLSGIALKWEVIMTSFEMEYFLFGHGLHETLIDDTSTKPSTPETAKEKQSEPLHGQTESMPKQGSPPDNAVPLAPVAMQRLATLRRSIGGSPAETGHDAQNTEQSIANERAELVRTVGAVPNSNDVLMGANHHTHPGNMQFFNSLLMCAHDFSEVSDCFVDALKLIEPPGRFLAKDEASGSWDQIDYDDAINYVHYLADNHALNSQTRMGSDSESDSVFLDAVQRNIDNKFNPVEHRIRQLSEVSLAESGLRFLDESCGTSKEPSMSSTIESGSMTALQHPDERASALDERKRPARQFNVSDVPWYCKDNIFDQERSCCEAEQRDTKWMMFHDCCFEDEGHYEASEGHGAFYDGTDRDFEDDCEDFEDEDNAFEDEGHCEASEGACAFYDEALADFEDRCEDVEDDDNAFEGEGHDAATKDIGIQDDSNNCSIATNERINGTSSKDNKTWELKNIFTRSELKKPNPIICSLDNEGASCDLVACSTWVLGQNTRYLCLDCQQRVYKGWPKPGSGELPMQFLTEENCRVIAKMCSKQETPQMPDLPKLPSLFSAASAVVGLSEDCDEEEQELRPQSNKRKYLATTPVTKSKQKQKVDCGISQMAELQRLYEEKKQECNEVVSELQLQGRSNAEKDAQIDDMKQTIRMLTRQLEESPKSNNGDAVAEFEAEAELESAKKDYVKQSGEKVNDGSTNAMSVSHDDDSESSWETPKAWMSEDDGSESSFEWPESWDA